MTKDQQAELEQAARAWLVKMGFGHRVTARGLQESVAVQKDVDSLVTLLAAQRAAVLEEIREAAIPFLHFRNWANRGCTVTMMEKVLIDLLGDVEVAGSNDAAYQEYEDTYKRQRDILYPSPRKQAQEQ